MMLAYWQIALFGLACFVLGAGVVILSYRSFDRDDAARDERGWSARRIFEPKP